MASTIHDDFMNSDEHFCGHCLTAQDRWAVRCYRCDASFQGAGRYCLITGRPNLDAPLIETLRSAPVTQVGRAADPSANQLCV